LTEVMSPRVRDVGVKSRRERKHGGADCVTALISTIYAVGVHYILHEEKQEGHRAAAGGSNRYEYFSRQIYYQSLPATATITNIK